MGCSRCIECDRKFEHYDLQEYMAGQRDEDDEDDEGYDDYEYDTCPNCLMKQREDTEKKAELVALKAELKAVRAEVKTLREASASSTSSSSSNQADRLNSQSLTLQTEVETLRAENKKLQEALSASKMVDLTNDSDSDDQASKTNKRSRTNNASLSSSSGQTTNDKSVWVLARGSYPDHQLARIVDVEVVGSYSSEEKAQDAKQDYLDEGGWEEGGYGYHRGEDEHRIEIYETVLDE